MSGLSKPSIGSGNSLKNHSFWRPVSAEKKRAFSRAPGGIFASMTPRSSDTTPAAADVQLAVYRQLSDEQRFALALEMSAFTRSLTESEIRRLHPEWNDRAVKGELARLALFPAPLPPGAE